ncbi:craniofacial development protein 1-like isoform X2 [Chenopodium quinoa]|nr:craniofacial development protein 1-like isoform X2 [Chenopodium quinoa]XP_021762150.1 craniofacial development protein 1-like isoform X2 [Chenopodium quinoa]
MEAIPVESKNETASVSAPQAEPVDHEIKARVDAVWQKMNKGVSANTLNSIVNKRTPNGNKTPQTDKASNNWMSLLGLGPKKPEEANKASSERKRSATAQSAHNGTSDEAKKLAATALAAARDAAVAASASNRGKVEVTEFLDFAGEEIEVKKMVDPSSKEAAERAKVEAGPSSAVDSVLEQIKKKPKLSLLDKTKKDWGEFKGENKDYEEELDAYKKSSNQYLDKVSFLNRADYREFERERDVRLAQQAKRKPDMREGP